VIENGRGIVAFTRKSFTVLKSGDGMAASEPVTPGFPWIHHAVDHGDDILVLTDDGIWSAHGQPLVLRKRTVISHFVEPANPNAALVGLRFGVARIEKVEANWVEHEVRDVSFDVTGVARDAAGSIW